MDFLPGIDQLRKNSEKAAAQASQKRAEREKSLKEKAWEEHLMREMAQEYYQKMDAVISPVRCLTSKDQGFWKRIFGDRDCISGHILKKPGGAGGSPVYYLIDADGRRWAVVKDSSTRQFDWLIKRIVPYDGRQFPRAGSPSDNWKQGLTHNLKRAVDQSTFSKGPVSAKEAKRQGRDAGIAGITLHRAKEALGVRSRKEEANESNIDLGESSESYIDIDKRILY